MEAHKQGRDVLLVFQKNVGSVVTWGDGYSGGDSTGVDFSGGVDKFFVGLPGFAVLRNDGSLVAWGYDNRVINLAAPTIELIYTSL